MITRAQLFPVVMLLLQVGAAVIYGLAGDWRRCLYWTAAVAITVAVTF